MAVDYSKGLKVNYPIIILGGLMFLAAAILTFLLIIKNVFGNYKISEILPTKENLTMVSAKREVQAAILYSRYTENTLPEGNTWVSDNIDTWERFLKQIKIDYKIIDDQDIELNRLDKYGLLILPGAKSLSDKQLVHIKQFLENGGSVFSTSGTATFSDEGKWRGWEFFSEVFGMSFTKELEPDEFYSKIHTLRGNLPITAGIPTGYALNVATWDRPIYAEVRDPRTTQGSFWFDFRQEAGLVREQVSSSAGISFGTYGEGRFVWFGFELNSVIGREETYSDKNYWTYFFNLVENSVNWLTYLPTAYVKDWPAPYEAAAIFTPTISRQPANINNLKGILSRNDYPATIFVEPSIAERNPKLIKGLTDIGNVSAIVDIGFKASAFDTTNQLYKKEEQKNNISSAVNRISKITEKPVKGIMPFYGYYNDWTKHGMAASGVEYLLTDSLTDRSVPRLEIWNEKPLLVMGNTARDDIHIIGKYGLTQKEYQRYTYEEDVDRVLFEGGLYVFKVHTNYQLRPEYVSVVDDVLSYIRSKNIWLTSLDEIQNWWSSRGEIEFRYETRSKRRLAIEVFNPEENPKENFVVQIYLNKKVTDIEISSDIINTPIPEYNFDTENNILTLFVNDMESSESRNFFIDFENVSLF